MKFNDCKSFCDIFDCFVADGSNQNFEDTEQAFENFRNYLIGIEGLKADSLKGIYEQALLLSITLEQQGFFYGMYKGMQLEIESALMERK